MVFLSFSWNKFVIKSLSSKNPHRNHKYTIIPKSYHIAIFPIIKGILALTNIVLNMLKLS